MMILYRYVEDDIAPVRNTGKRNPRTTGTNNRNSTNVPRNSQPEKTIPEEEKVDTSELEGNVENANDNFYAAIGIMQKVENLLESSFSINEKRIERDSINEIYANLR